ncbi:hypothetical protein ACFQ61_08245 [Streptomyces sp. NPDC056500]|uniref:hypothetical protein n=1 Tax=Streptomyces sp. NPDC056500 TaxID=3345840 RepID=UPI003684FEB5
MTSPGQSTPWGSFPIPSAGKVPDVPVDLAAVVDPIDTLLKNVIGGMVAPTGPLSPTLLEASASIGSLNATQSSQQSVITTMQGQITALSAAPHAVATPRTTLYSLAGNVRTPNLVHSYQLPTFAQTRLLIIHATMALGWTDGTTTASVRGRLMIRNNGASIYTDRVQDFGYGTDQTLSMTHIETLTAGHSIRLGLFCDIFGAAAATKSVESQEFDPRIYAIALPWTGPAVAPIPS